MFVLNSLESDKELWNNFIDALPSNFCSFFQSAWLYSECYMYRKVFSFFENSQTLKTYDYFFKQKEQSLKMDEVLGVAKRLSRPADKDLQTFSRLLKVLASEEPPINEQINHHSLF